MQLFGIFTVLATISSMGYCQDCLPAYMAFNDRPMCDAQGTAKYCYEASVICDTSSPGNCIFDAVSSPNATVAKCDASYSAPVCRISATTIATNKANYTSTCVDGAQQQCLDVAVFEGDNCQGAVAECVSCVSSFDPCTVDYATIEVCNDTGLLNYFNVVDQQQNFILPTIPTCPADTNGEFVYVENIVVGCSCAANFPGFELTYRICCQDGNREYGCTGKPTPIERRMCTAEDCLCTSTEFFACQTCTNAASVEECATSVNYTSCTHQGAGSLFRNKCLTTIFNYTSTSGAAKQVVNRGCSTYQRCPLVQDSFEQFNLNKEMYAEITELAPEGAPDICSTASSTSKACYTYNVQCSPGDINSCKAETVAKGKWETCDDGQKCELNLKIIGNGKKLMLKTQCKSQSACTAHLKQNVFDASDCTIDKSTMWANTHNGADRCYRCTDPQALSDMCDPEIVVKTLTKTAICDYGEKNVGFKCLDQGSLALSQIPSSVAHTVATIPAIFTALLVYAMLTSTGN